MKGIKKESKRILSIVLSLMMIFGGLTLSTSSVHADDTYIGEGIKIQYTSTSESSVDFSISEDKSGKGWSYDHTTNTLTLDNFNGHSIIMYEKSPTFNILLKGDNNVDYEIYSNSSMIIDGTSDDRLIINENKEHNSSIMVHEGLLTINNINLVMYGGYAPCILCEGYIDGNNGILNNLASLEIYDAMFPLLNLKIKGMELLDENNEVLPILNATIDGIKVPILFKHGTTQKYIDVLDMEAFMQETPHTVKGKKVSSYTATSGANQKLVEKEAKDATFTFDGPLEYLDKVYINDKELDAANYTTASGSTIITLDKDYVSTLTLGTYTLRADYTNEVSASTTFNVEKKAETVTTPTYAKTASVVVKASGYKYGFKTIVLKKGKTVTLRGAVLPATAMQGVTFESLNTKVATVSSNGKVKAKKTGTAKIRVLSKDKSKSKIITIKVIKRDKVNTKLSVSKKTLTVKKGNKGQIKIKSLTKDTTSKVTYKSKKKSVATVNSYGVVTAKKKGTTYATVKCGKKSVKVKIKVK